MTDSQDFVNVDPIDVGPETDPKGSQPALSTSEENTLAMFAHLSILLNLVTGFLGLVPAAIIYFAHATWRTRACRQLSSNWYSSLDLLSWRVLLQLSPPRWCWSASVFLDFL